MAIWSDILYKLKDILTSIGTNGTLIDESLQDVQANQVLQLNRTITGYATPSSYTLVNGTVVSGTIENTMHRDRTYLIIGESEIGFEIIFDFVLPTGQILRRINFAGQYIGGSGHIVDVYIYNYSNKEWDEISTTNFKDILPTENDVYVTWDFDNSDYVDSGGNTRIRFKHANGGDVSHTFKIDCVSCGDYKSPQLLSDINSNLNDLKTLTNRGYIELRAEGDKTIYDLDDPRVKTANINEIQCIGDLIDDADFKGINIPIVDQFNDTVTPSGGYRWKTNNWIAKSVTQPISWGDIPQSLVMRKNILWNLCELQDKRVLDFYLIPEGDSGVARFRWRILPENFTSSDFQNTPSNYQNLAQTFTSWTTASILRSDAYYFNGKVYMYFENDAGGQGSFELNFNPDIGFSGGKSNGGGGSALGALTKGAALTKSKGDEPYYIYTDQAQGATKFTIKPISATGYKQFTLPNGKSYLGGSQITIAPYYNDSNDDTFIVAMGTGVSTVTTYKVEYTAGTITELQNLTVTDIGLTDTHYAWLYTRDDGESVLGYYDDNEGDQLYYYSSDYGDTFVVEGYDFSAEIRSRPFISTDRVYMMKSVTSGSALSMYINPLDLTIFSEAIISYDDLSITFSKSLVSGTKFYIIKYVSENRVVKNEVEYNEDGVAVRKPFLTTQDPADYFTEVSLGNVPGQSVQIKFGTNGTVGTSNEVIWDNGNGYNWLGGATLLNFTSDNVNDTSAGSGARTLNIFGLDANYDLQEETIILTGQTIKQSANTYIRLYRAIVMTEGATADANTGTLYCFTGTETGGVPDDSTKIYMAMRPTLGQTLMAVYTVPAGKTAVLRSAWITAGGDKVVTGQLFVRPFGGAKNLKMDVDILNYLFFRPFLISQLFAEKTDIWIEGKVDVASFKLSAGFDLLLIDN